MNKVHIRKGEPFRVYKNSLLFSIDPAIGGQLPTDLVLDGNPQLIAQGLCEMMERHQALAELIIFTSQMFLRDHPKWQPSL